MNETCHTSWVDSIKSLAKRLSPDFLVIALFATLSLAYFLPAGIEGRELFQHDVAGASGTAQDVREYYDKTGETSYWTNSLFGGMPMYQIAPSYPSLKSLKTLQDICSLQWPLSLMPSYSWLLFLMSLGFYLFMRSLKMERWASALGALMWTFSSYFIILIDAGHIWKLMALSFVPPTIAGIIWIYEGRYLKGGVLTALFASLQLMSNHVQMSYYFSFVIALLIASYLYRAVREQKYQAFFKASITTIFAGIVAICVNGSNIYHTYQYTQETMRGGSALSASSTTYNKPRGLDKSYITAWSYGKAETLTFLIPNLYGGASGALGANEDALSKVTDAETKEILSGMNHYWGDQPFTSGPVYVGAFVLFLALLGAFIIRTPLKWALVASTILSVLLGWGHNLMWVSDLFIDYFPLYNKFRTVSSILVIAEFTIPTLATLALVEFIKSPSSVLGQKKFLYTSLALTLGVALIIALAPGMFFDFLSTQEQEMFRQHLTNSKALEVIKALKDVRSDIVSSDAWRSVFVILLSLAVCYCYVRNYLQKRIALALLTAITLLDLWMVDKRYLNDDKFIDKSIIEAQATPVTDVDVAIKKDLDPHYRVLNLSVSPFSDATTSYSHRSIGGYHAAKLSRYQDLIERQISANNHQVLNMLNTRYIIAKDSLGRLFASHNPEAFGSAWFVDLDRLKIVDTPREEMEALSSLNLRHEAVLDRDQSIKVIGSPQDTLASTDTQVYLLEYTPNRAKYKVSTDRERLLVFSEIYYPYGWSLFVDGKPQEIKRANYLLRATLIPSGEHTVEMHFNPKSIRTTETISYVAQACILIATCLWGIRTYRRKQKHQNNTSV